MERTKRNRCNSVKFHRIAPIVSPMGSRMCLDVRAWRHGSSEVANYFKAGLDSHNALGFYTWTAPLWSELNFAVFGTLLTWPSMKALDQGLKREPRIAQGHNSHTNNWWIAGAKYYLQNGLLKCSWGLHLKVSILSPIVRKQIGWLLAVAEQLSSTLVKTNPFCYPFARKKMVALWKKHPLECGSRLVGPPTKGPNNTI